jgi:Zn finger protein HypA/HybF involved in hydrogenase expression
MREQPGNGDEGAATLICPVCKEERDWTLTPYDETWVRRARGWSGQYFSDWYHDKRIEWACHQCLKSSRALVADPSKQRFGMGGGVKAYADMPRSCRRCKRPFVFAAAEQRFWFEELQFQVDSLAVECPDCRASKRVLVQANQDLADSLRVLDANDAEQLERIAALYEVLGSEKKGAEFRRRAANARRRQSSDPPGNP